MEKPLEIELPVLKLKAQDLVGAMVLDPRNFEGYQAGDHLVLRVLFAGDLSTVTSVQVVEGVKKIAGILHFVSGIGYSLHIGAQQMLIGVVGLEE